MRCAVVLVALMLACGEKEGARVEPLPHIEFRAVERSFGSFDAPAETGDWLVLQDGWDPLSPACRDEEYRRRYPAACAPNPGPTDGRFDMRRLQPGRAPVTLHFQAYPTAAPAESLRDEEVARLRGGGAEVETREVAGARALVARREHVDIGHGEETLVLFSGHLMLRWQVGGPLADAPTVRAVMKRVIDTVALGATGGPASRP